MMCVCYLLMLIEMGWFFRLVVVMWMCLEWCRGNCLLGNDRYFLDLRLGLGFFGLSGII